MKKIVFFTGAGISAESGIQTFRDSDGLWENHDVKSVGTMEGWRKDRELVLRFFNERRQKMSTAKPNDAHLLVAELEKFFEVKIITQNIDNLHEEAGSTHVLHLHGEMKKACSCNNKSLVYDWDKDINIGDKAEDGAQLRPFVVWFGEDVPLMKEAKKIAKEADYFIVIGTSLQVYPAAGLLQDIKNDCLLIVINPENTGEFGKRAVVLKHTATEGMKKLFPILVEGAL